MTTAPKEKKAAKAAAAWGGPGGTRGQKAGTHAPLRRREKKTAHEWYDIIWHDDIALYNIL